MKRRDVLKTGAALGAAMLFPGSRVTAQTDQDDALNVALIGLGLQGSALVNACLSPAMKGVRFRAVCDIWDYRQQFGKYYLSNYGHDVNTYADYREMLDKEPQLDAVLIATPDFVHSAQTVACLEAGRHVYCESLMSDSLESARSMVRTMRETGKLLQIGYQRRSNPRYQHVKNKLLDQARLVGEIAQVNTQWILPLSGDRGWPRRKTISDEILARNGYADMHEFRNWRWYKKYCGGLFGNLGTHQVDVVHWFLDALPTSVFATGSQGHSARQWSENVTAVYDYATRDRNVQSLCQMLTATRGDGTGSHECFMGTQGTVRVSQNPRWTAVFRDPDAPEWDEWVRRDFVRSTKQQRVSRSERVASEISETGEVERFALPVVLDRPVLYPHLANFFDAIRGTATLNCPADVAIASEAAVLKTMQPLESGQRLQFMEEDFRA